MSPSARGEEALAAELLDASTEVILMLDRVGRLLYCNEAFVRRFDRTRDQAIGKSVFEVLPEPLASSRRAALEQVVETGRIFVFEDERDGRAFETQIHPIHNSSGEVERVAVYTRELTGIQEARQALSESEARLRVITESLPIPIWVSSAADGRILFANEGLYTLLGLPSGSLLGETTPDMYENPEDRAALIAELRSKGRVRNLEVPVRLPNGERRVIWASADLIKLDGQPAIMGCFVDVTERREIEAQLRQAQKMEALGRLGGGIAHDFNNLLQAIDSYADLARSALSEDTPSWQDLGELRQVVEQATRLTAQLTAYSRRHELDPQAVDLNALVTKMANMLRRLLGGGIRLDTRLQEPLAGVWVDPSRLEQVLMNLVLNARDAMPEGGAITVETASLEAGDAAIPAPLRGTACVRLSVADTGAGMDEDTRAHVFEPFFTTKAEGEGTGLGLATVFGIIRQSGGEIEVESIVGEGSTFSVFFERREAGSAAPQ